MMEVVGTSAEGLSTKDWWVWVKQNMKSLDLSQKFPFSALTLLVGNRKGIQLGVGLLVVMIWLELCTAYGSSCHHFFHHPLLRWTLANPGSPGKWPLKCTEREWIHSLGTSGEKIKGQLANLGLPRKWASKWCVCVCGVCVLVFKGLSLYIAFVSIWCFVIHLKAESVHVSVELVVQTAWWWHKSVCICRWSMAEEILCSYTWLQQALSALFHKEAKVTIWCTAR